MGNFLKNDEDNFFTELATAGDIPLELVDNIAAAATPLAALFQ